MVLGGGGGGGPQGAVPKAARGRWLRQRGRPESDKA